ncbi:MAG: SurA N-terminal domain-containing protein [Candidatus Adiutrix sp.]|jgi:peptidyl-prolyl cis-trans isomerase SurA|nr:SurA N-terminal domain-containing protein [Candidatus Adiutrix sp.]
MPWRIFFGLLFSLLLLAAPPAGAAVDRIVAVVNGEVITLKQLNNRVDSILRSQRGGAANRDQMLAQVLDALIEQELVNQAAKSKGVFVTESDVSMALESIKQENNLTTAQFEASLARSGLSVEAFREDLRIELLRNRVLGTPVVSKIVVTDKEVRAYLRGEGPDLGPVDFTPGNDKRPLRMLVIPLDKKNKEKSMAEARKIKMEIDGGLDWKAAVKKYTRGPGRDNGGDPGDGSTVATLPPQLQMVLADLGSGQPTEPLEIGGGQALVLISAVGDPPPKPQPKAVVKGQDDPRQFSDEEMEKGRRMLERYKMQQRYGEWVKDLRRNAIIRINL